MRRTVSLSLALVLVLAVVGVGYAAWSHTLTISGSVATGSLEHGLKLGETDTSEHTVNGTAKANIGLVAPDPELVRDDFKINSSVTVTLTNTYPGYWAQVPITFKNTGTIPLKLVETTDTASDELTVTLAPAVAEEQMQLEFAVGASQAWLLKVEVPSRDENQVEMSQSNYSFNIEFSVQQGIGLPVGGGS